jgi:hypothetical protein
LGNVITIDDERIKRHLDRGVRGSVEETLNALLDAEADRLCNAQRYERSQARRDTGAAASLGVGIGTVQRIAREMGEAGFGQSAISPSGRQRNDFMSFQTSIISFVLPPCR